MMERRRQRSERKDEALRLLLESVRDRSEITSIAVVDEQGLLVAGEGPERELLVLGAVAAPAAEGAFDAACERITVGADVVACPVELAPQTMYLAALGKQVSRMPDAALGVARILRAS